MSHLRPISLCNITYKIASKVHANCLKSILKYIVSESQSAFIPGRLITDNVLITYELNHYLAHKTWGSVGHAALKLDLSKAYDYVEWSFLVRVLAKLGFHPQALSHLISMTEVNGSLRCVPVSWHGPRVSHLLFADDTLIFCQATRDAMLYVKEFEEASGLMGAHSLGVAFSRRVICSYLGYDSILELGRMCERQVRLFACRAHRDALPTSCKLASCGVLIEGACLRCSEEGEDLIHVLLRCHFARLIWAMSCLPWRSISCPQPNLETWFRACSRTSIDQALLELFSFVRLSGVLTSGCSSRIVEFQRRSSSNGFGDWNILSLALVGRLWVWRIPSSRRRRPFNSDGTG
ncbi:UNVERIFIED_CONTAM: hypothetical protein Sradi_4890500 [Sesamum radiatum]|uniref:Reverse transcriptase domain-containing protein n=1 Tax=Sesamum radiatum TaxID=300843 RepID=A0AAW2MDJ6_SESRA